MAFDRVSGGYNTSEGSPERLIKIEPIRYDKEGRIIRGDYPQNFITRIPQRLNTHGILEVKDNNDLMYDFMNILIVNRLSREAIPDEEFTIQDMIDEINIEAAAKGNNTRNKEGKYNNRILMNTAMTVSESTTKNIEAQPRKAGFLNGLWSRK